MWLSHSNILHRLFIKLFFKRIKLKEPSWYRPIVNDKDF